VYGAHSSLEAIEHRFGDTHWLQCDVEIGELTAHDVTEGEAGCGPVNGFFDGIRGQIAGCGVDRPGFWQLDPRYTSRDLIGVVVGRAGGFPDSWGLRTHDPRRGAQAALTWKVKPEQMLRQMQDLGIVSEGV
jgi:hypothetical protein